MHGTFDFDPTPLRDVSSSEVVTIASTLGSCLIAVSAGIPNALFAFTSAFSADHKLSLPKHAWFLPLLVAVATAGLQCTFITTPLHARHGPARTALLCGLTAALGCLLFSFATHPATLLLSLFALSVAAGTAFVAALAPALALGHPAAVAAVSVSMSLSITFSVAGANAISSLCGENTGACWRITFRVFCIAATLLTVAGAALMAASPLARKQPPQAALPSPQAHTVARISELMESLHLPRAREQAPQSQRDSHERASTLGHNDHVGLRSADYSGLTIDNNDNRLVRVSSHNEIKHDPVSTHGHSHAHDSPSHAHHLTAQPPSLLTLYSGQDRRVFASERQIVQRRSSSKIDTSLPQHVANNGTNMRISPPSNAISRRRTHVPPPISTQPVDSRPRALMATQAHPSPLLPSSLQPFAGVTSKSEPAAATLATSPLLPQRAQEEEQRRLDATRAMRHIPLANITVQTNATAGNLSDLDWVRVHARPLLLLGIANALSIGGALFYTTSLPALWDDITASNAPVRNATVTPHIAVFPTSNHTALLPPTPLDSGGLPGANPALIPTSPVTSLQYVRNTVPPPASLAALSAILSIAIATGNVVGPVLAYALRPTPRDISEDENLAANDSKVRSSSQDYDDDRHSLGEARPRFPANASAVSRELPQVRSQTQLFSEPQTGGGNKRRCTCACTLPALLSVMQIISSFAFATVTIAAFTLPTALYHSPANKALLSVASVWFIGSLVMIAASLGCFFSLLPTLALQAFGARRFPTAVAAAQAGTAVVLLATPFIKGALLRPHDGGMRIGGAAAGIAVAHAAAAAATWALGRTHFSQAAVVKEQRTLWERVETEAEEAEERAQQGEADEKMKEEGLARGERITVT